MKLSVIITTYNSEEWLQKVLVGYSVQTELDFEVVIADDGSTEKTKSIIDSFKDSFKYPIVHVRQEDNGFQTFSFALQNHHDLINRHLL
ncbi:glycosyltransferase [Flavobacterium sasangense]|uniref:glycosyltransferase n=1 Tax=Flavobacterium sasangense TaxID=503361 RepID=UPI0009FE2C57|nr:glycosyltransferase [Flavobacterium sasangense]